MVERRNDNKAVFMYKITNGEYLANISNIFNVANNQAYSLRSNNTDYAFDKPKTNFLKKTSVIQVLKRGTIYLDPLRLEIFL